VARIVAKVAIARLPVEASVFAYYSPVKPFTSPHIRQAISRSLRDRLRCLIRRSAQTISIAPPIRRAILYF
jgi:hypothetical protein